ncbi:MAG: EFR1 family ferrodoxin [Lachnospiraceae bacterium]|nr:EFR1 family ferrodoxin [Lachnospiraceae bacterium]
MNNQSTIFWFSGTGNSLYAARKLSQELDIALTQITEAAPSGAVGGNGVKVGFVFPSYYLNLPRAVRTFVEKLEIKPDTYIFSVVTMGGVGHGSITAMNRALKNKGLNLNYGKGIKMPDNYVLLYNPADSVASETLLNKNDTQLRKIAAEIKSEKQAAGALPFIMNNLYKKIERLDDKFTVSEGCTGCGLCENICPVRNIRLEAGKPVWKKHCEHCVACISWCPVKAIEYGDKTQSRRRYRNPRIKAADLKRKNDEVLLTGK